MLPYQTLSDYTLLTNLQLVARNENFLYGCNCIKGFIFSFENTSFQNLATMPIIKTKKERKLMTNPLIMIVPKCNALLSSIP